MRSLVCYGSLTSGSQYVFYYSLPCYEILCDSKVLLEPFYFYTHVGDFDVGQETLYELSIFVFHKVASCYLVELEMNDFDIILSMD